MSKELLCEVLGCEQLPIDEKYATNQMRVKNRAELAEELKRFVDKFNADDLLSKLLEINVPAAKIKNVAEVFEDTTAQSLVLDEDIEGVKTRRVRSSVFKIHP